MTDSVCCKCGRAPDNSKDERDKIKVELRPYGPGGAPICYQCATAPEQKAETERNFKTMLDAAEAASPLGIAVMGVDLPPSPLLELPEE